MNIDIGQFVNNAKVLATCDDHPGCKGCPYFTTQMVDGTLCETAVYRIKNGEKNE